MAQKIKSWNNGIVEDQSGSTLPTVNADDNGKTLQVVDGQWDKGGKIPDPQLPTPAVGDIGKIVGAVSDGESGAEYGLVELNPKKTNILMYYVVQGSVYKYMVNGVLKSLEDLYNMLVDKGLADDPNFSNKITFQVNCSGDPNLPANFTGGSFFLDIVSASLTSGDYYGLFVKGNVLTNPEYVSGKTGIANVFADISYNQWTQLGTVTVNVIDFATPAQN